MLMHSKFRLFLQLVQPVTCPLVRKVRKAFAVVHEPARMSDNPIKFTAGLTAAVRLVADLENVPKLDNVRIRVCNLHLFVLLFLFAISNNPPPKKLCYVSRMGSMLSVFFTFENRNATATQLSFTYSTSDISYARLSTRTQA